MFSMDRFDRIRGCAVGAAVGDALGMPLEFQPPRPVGQWVTQMTSGRLPAGSFTDDTEMALALADSLLNSAPLDAQDLADRFVDWYAHHPPDVGIQTRMMLGWMKEGLDWETASRRILKERPENAGNGSLMRCWPVALAWVEDFDQLAFDSALQSQITHPHPDCISACILLNSMIALLIQGVNRVAAFERALKLARPKMDFELLLRHAYGRERHELHNSGWVRHTLETALWSLFSTHSFEEALIAAANLGNDADTGAAVTGALAGACYGLDAIPAQWRADLKGEWPLGSGIGWTERDFILTAERLSVQAIRQDLD